MNPNPSVDWDGELQLLMESAGIDPKSSRRAPWRSRQWRRLKSARAGLAAVAVVAPLLWVIARSGAPNTAVIPVALWLTSFGVLGIWISLGRPDWHTTANTATRCVAQAWRRVSRAGHLATRPIRTRLRAAAIVRAARHVEPNEVD